MKFIRNVIHQLAICIGVLAFIFSSWINALGTNLEEKKEVVISSGTYAPWSGKKLYQGGFINHVITKAFASQGYQVKFRYLPWKRSYAETKAGVSVASSYWYYSKDREANFIHSDAIYTESVYFIYNKVRPLKQWRTLDDLSDFIIGATDGFTYTKDFWNKVKNKTLKVELTTSDELNMRKLVKRRVDLVPLERHVAYHIVRQNYGEIALKDIDFNPKPLAVKTDHLLFSRKYPDVNKLVLIFNKGLAAINKSGEVARLEELFLKGTYDKELN